MVSRRIFWFDIDNKNQADFARKVGRGRDIGNETLGTDYEWAKVKGNIADKGRG